MWGSSVSHRELPLVCPGTADGLGLPARFLNSLALGTGPASPPQRGTEMGPALTPSCSLG